MGALNNTEVGKFINEHFVSSFQKVATFRIVGKQKQGGNVAAYFCAPDSRVLHVVAGPVSAKTLLREAKWVIETTKQGIKQAKGDGAKFKAHFRKAHATRLRKEHGFNVEPVTFDPEIEQDPKSALTYQDPSGRPLAPKLPPPPVDGPPVKFRAKQNELARASAAVVLDRRGRRWRLGNQGRVHRLMAAHSLRKIETVYAAVFQGILGEKISTKPVEVLHPFPWVKRGATQKR